MTSKMKTSMTTTSSKIILRFDSLLTIWFSNRFRFYEYFKTEDSFIVMVVTKGKKTFFQTDKNYKVTKVGFGKV